MTAFRSFILKEAQHILRDRRTMLILFGMPVVLMLLFGFAITNDVKNVRTVVVTSTMNLPTQQVIERLSASEYFTITQTAATSAEAERIIRNQQADMAIVFEPDFASRNAGIQLIVDTADPNMAQQWTNYAQAIIAQALVSTSTPNGQWSTVNGQSSILNGQWSIVNGQRSMVNGQSSMVNGQWSIVNGQWPTVNTKMLYNPQMRSAYNFVPAIMGMLLMLVCAMMTSISIVREKERGTMEVLLVSPVKPLLIIVAKAVPYLVLALAILTVILLMAFFVLRVPLAGSVFWMAAISLLYILLALSLGLLISNIATTQLMALLMSAMVLLMPIVMLSGMIFPVESMPTILQYVSAIVPPRYYIAAMRKLMIMGVGVEYVWREVATLAGMTAFLLCVALFTFKQRLE